MFRPLWFVLVLCLLSTSAAAFAQDEATRAASARALFEEGVGLAEHEQWSDAVDRFQRALSLRDSQVIRFNLAIALAELGRLVESSELLRAVLRADALDPPLRAQAEQRLALVTPRIARLTLAVAGTAGAAQVELDGDALPAAMVGVAIPVDPGSHRARLLQGAQELAASERVLAEGASETLTLERSAAPTAAETAAVALAAPVSAGPALAVASHEPTRRDGDARDDRKKKALWWGLGGGAVLAAGAIVAGVLLAPHAKKASPYRGDFEPGSVNVQVTP
jgi:hypothetical protein